MNFCFSSCSDDDDVTIQLSDPNVLVFKVLKSRYNAEKIITMLLDPGDETLICTERSTNIRTFVIDLDELQQPDDAKRGNFRKWAYSGSHTTPFQAWFSESGLV